MKTCYKCRAPRAEAEFYLRSDGRVMNQCKSCCKAAVQACRAGIRAPKTTISATPTQEEVATVLAYEPASGTLTWRITRGNVLAGSVAGSVNNKGYRVVFIGGKGYKAHRLAWLLSHGAWPTGTINHINGHKDDNRIGNLEDISSPENTRHAFKTGLKDTSHLQAYWARRRQQEK
jgi:hypothetical protein